MFQKNMGYYDLVDMFIAPSNFMRLSMAHRFAKDRLRLLRNGIDLSKFPPCEENKGYVLYVGRLSQEKGVRTLLKPTARRTATGR